MFEKPKRVLPLKGKNSDRKRPQTASFYFSRFSLRVCLLFVLLCSSGLTQRQPTQGRQNVQKNGLCMVHARNKDELGRLRSKWTGLKLLLLVSKVDLVGLNRDFRWGLNSLPKNLKFAPDFFFFHLISLNQILRNFGKSLGFGRFSRFIQFFCTVKEPARLPLPALLSMEDHLERNRRTAFWIWCVYSAHSQRWLSQLHNQTNPISSIGRLSFYLPS